MSSGDVDAQLRRRNTGAVAGDGVPAGIEDDNLRQDLGRPWPPHSNLLEATSPADLRALLCAFYTRFNPGNLARVDHIIEEMDTRVAQQMATSSHDRQSLVFSELARINQKLRETYNGNDLSCVMPQVSARRPESSQPLSSWAAVIGFLIAICLLFLAIDDEVFAKQPHLQAFPPHRHSGWRQQVQDKIISLDVSLEEAYRGKKGSVSVKRQAVCTACHGSGAQSSKPCPHCGGHGHSVGRSPFGYVRMECSACGGQGWIPTQQCPVCGGQGVHNHRHEVEYSLPPGAVAGMKYTLRGQGDQAPHANSGDLVLAIRELEHPRFRRVGAHLHIDVYLTLEEALLGWARDLEHLDGEILSFSHSDLHKQLQDAGKLGAGLDQGDPIVTPMGAALRWRAKGLPQGSNRSGRGDLLVHFKVQLPELTSEQADRMRSLLA